MALNIKNCCYFGKDYKTPLQTAASSVLQPELDSPVHVASTPRTPKRVTGVQCPRKDVGMSEQQLTAIFSYLP